MTGKTAAPVGGLIANGCRLDISGSSFHGTVSSSATSGSVYLGGLVGRISISGVTIARCFVDADVIASGGSQIGGLAGSCANGCSVSISDCYTKGALKGKGSYIGGIVGDLTVDSSVQRCYSTMPISGVYNHGGIVGRASNLSNPYSKHTFETPMNICVAKCIAWNPSIATTGSGENPNSHYSSGAVVGFTVWKNPLSECFRRPDMSFSVYANPDYNVLTDNDDVSPEHLLVRPSEDTYHCPYNGKAAAAGQTVSSLAAALGWSPSVWDMSADLPVLR